MYDESSIDRFLWWFKDITGEIYFLKLFMNRHPHPHRNIERSHNFLIKINGNGWCNNRSQTLPRFSDQRLQINICSSKMMSLITLQTPDINIKPSFFQIFYEELILLYFKAKFWLEIALATMDRLCIFCVMIVEVDCCQN